MDASELRQKTIALFSGRGTAEPEELFSRIRHAPRPDCLELAPTAAAQWRLMDATENLRKHDSAKPLQRRDPGRNLHVGCAAQTVGPRRNLPEHMALQPHTNPRCGAPAALPVLARRPRRAAGSSGQLLLRCVCAPVGRGEPGARGTVPGACARASAPGRRVVLRRRGS